MSLKLFSLFVRNLKQNLPRHLVRPGLQFRHIAAMETAAVEKPVDEKQEIVPNKTLTRFKKRFNKRHWDEPYTKQENGASDPKKLCERIKRKKMAMILGYSGVNYHVSIEEINKRLPECIRVFGVKRVTNRFNSKSKCNARTYSYTLPTFVFEPSLEGDDERKGYRITAEKFQKTSSRPVVPEGQSFMLHQIRKMVGLTIAVLRDLTDISIMDKAFGKEKVHYERYDAKFKDSHDSLTWDDVEEAIQKFKHEHIYPIIVKGEVEGNMA
ncbi:tRNA pseudouridine synthase, partial [Operophtera brumata]